MDITSRATFRNRDAFAARLAPRPRRRVLGAVLGALALVGAACGDGDSPSTVGTTSEPTETSSTPISSTTTQTTSAPSSSSPATTGSTTSEPPTTEAGETVEVFFSVGEGADCSAVRSFSRIIPSGADPIAVAFAELAAGPTQAETEQGVGSFFSTATAHVVRATTVLEQDTAVGQLLIVDFADLRPLMPNASTSCGSMALMSQLQATALQFPEIDRVRFQMQRSCDGFANWLQRECFEIDRERGQIDITTIERASGAGCTPPDGNGLPDGQWFGYVDDMEDDSLSFDLACWFSGQSAALAAGEDGEESPPPNDFHIRNIADRIRTISMDATAEVTWFANPSDPATAQTTGYDQWTDVRDDRDFNPGVWLTISDELVTSVEEQYVP